MKATRSLPRRNASAWASRKRVSQIHACRTSPVSFHWRWLDKLPQFNAADIVSEPVEAVNSLESSSLKRQSPNYSVDRY